MTPNPIFFDTFIAIGIIYLLHFGLYLVGANFYDVWQFHRQKKLPKRHHNTRPRVTVLIAAYNEELSIIRCLESIRKNTYRKWEVVVIDDGSKDKTHELVTQYICDHPNRTISLLKMPKNSGKAAALNYGLKRQAQGDLIMTLDADSILHKNAITNAVSYFGDEQIAGVAANVRVMESPTIIGLLQRFEHMIGYRSKKFYSLTNCEFIIGGVASTYRRSIMKDVGFYDTDTSTEDIGLSLKISSKGNKDHRLVYGVDVVAMTEGVKDFKTLLKQRYRWKMGMLQNLLKNKALFANNDPKFTWSLTMYRIPMAFLGEALLVLEPLAWAYLIYLSIAFHTISIFVGAYMTITLYIFWNIWPDEHASVRRKFSMSFYAPILYFVFYIMSIVQIVSIFRCLFNMKQITRKVKTDGKWVSPERTGQSVAIT